MVVLHPSLGLGLYSLSSSPPRTHSTRSVYNPLPRGFASAHCCHPLELGHITAPSVLDALCFQVASLLCKYATLHWAKGFSDTELTAQIELTQQHLYFSGWILTEGFNYRLTCLCSLMSLKKSPPTAVWKRTYLECLEI